LKLKFLQNVLAGVAKVSLLETFFPFANTYEDAVNRVDREYHPVVQKEPMKNDLSNLVAVLRTTTLVRLSAKATS